MKGKQRDSQETPKDTLSISILESFNEEKDQMRIWNWKTYILACLCSFLVSFAGGAILLFWGLKHHPTNTQLWMVPVGLILFCTPVFVCFSMVVSDLCHPREGGSANDAVGVQPCSVIQLLLFTMQCHGTWLCCIEYVPLVTIGLMGFFFLIKVANEVCLLEFDQFQLVQICVGLNFMKY